MGLHIVRLDDEAHHTAKIESAKLGVTLQSYLSDTIKKAGTK